MGVADAERKALLFNMLQQSSELNVKPPICKYRLKN